MPSPSSANGFDQHSPPRLPTWFCHECHRQSSSARSSEPRCSYCLSTFVEELEGDQEDRDGTSSWSTGARTLTDFQPDHSPPIPGTRQRYDQIQREQQQQHHRSTRSSNHHILDPLLNIFGIHPAPNQHNPEDEPERVTYQDQGSFNSYPSVRSSSRRFRFSLMMSRFIGSRSARPSNSRHASSTFTNTSNQPDPRLGQQSTGDRSPPAIPGRLADGLYTFTFDPRTTTPIFGFQPTSNTSPRQHTNNNDRSPESSDRSQTSPSTETDTQPAGSGIAPPQGLFTLFHQLLNQATQANVSITSTRPPFHQTSTSSPTSPDQTDNAEGRTRSSQNETQESNSANAWTDDGYHFHTGSATGAVNIEETHPLRQFLNLINSLNGGSEASNRTGLNGFFVNGGSSGFGFTTGSFGTRGHLGDYVFGESAMEDILNQLMNIAGNGRPEPPPATEEKIKSMKRFKFDSARSDGEPIECAICKDNFESGEECMELPCRHYFHSEACIQPWLKRNGTCPVCRFSLVNPEDRTTGSGEPQEPIVVNSDSIIEPGFDVD